MSELAIQVLTAIAPVLAVVVSGFMTRRQVAGVHEIVNSQRTTMVAEIDSLKAEVLALRSAIGAAVVKVAEAGKQLP